MVKESSELLDDISNWYVRRNRRRFWKSESDSDKHAAYLTLYHVLLTYIKVMSPIIPFISDKIYKNMIVSVDSNAPISIHLTDFPKYDNKLENADLINEIDSVKSIVSLGRSARNKANIKIRQPLSDISIYSKKGKQGFLVDYENQLKEELNVKKVNYVDKESSLVKYQVKPNFASLKSKYADQVSHIIEHISKTDHSEIMKALNSNNSYTFNDLNLEKEDFIIEEVPIDNYGISTDSNYVVGMNTMLNKTLVDEGLTRDVIRKVQNLRKESEFEVEDRIEININANDSICLALESNKKYFLSEVLGKHLTFNSVNKDFRVEVKLNDESIEISISKYLN